MSSAGTRAGPVLPAVPGGCGRPGRSLSVVGCLGRIVISSAAWPGLPAWDGQLMGAAVTASGVTSGARLCGPSWEPLLLKPDAGQESAEGGAVGRIVDRRPRLVLGCEHEGGTVVDGDRD